MALRALFKPHQKPRSRGRASPAFQQKLTLIQAVLFALTFNLVSPVAMLAQTAPDPASAVANDNLVLLGAQLFRSPLFSADSSVSCISCHLPALGFSGDRPLAVGVAGFVSARRAPALLGLRDTKALMWDGRAPDLRSQAAIPLESPEMATAWPAALFRLRADPTVTELARKAGLTSIDRDSALTALAAYVASLDAGKSRFDRYYYGQELQALTTQESWGFRLFVRKAHCGNCHLADSRSAPFTDNAFHATGIGQVGGFYKDRGRGAITGDPADEGAFRTPSLRGVALRPYLMHDGSITSLRQAVEHYNRGINQGSAKADHRPGPLHLTSDEVDAIAAFLAALTPDSAASAPGSAALR